MKHISEFRDGQLATKLGAELQRQAARLDRSITLMEVCGTHTMSIYRHGIRSTFVPDNIRLVSGPGCPVCVTPKNYVDAALELARKGNVIITTFGDMLRVPGSTTSLQKERARGADVRVVYSPLDAVDIAKGEREKEVVFLGVGFETTAPTVAAAIKTAQRDGVTNFSALTSLKVMPEPMDALTDGELAIDGYICPAHVSAIIGEAGYRKIVEKRHLPCVITGFEPLDILRGITMLVAQIADGRAEVENEYSRVVLPEGNVTALELLADVFEKCDAQWRGLGDIPQSGLKISSRYAEFDSVEKFGIKFSDVKDNPACLCGAILKGLNQPEDCALFGTTCRPDNPIGACMVSSEGTCAAQYRYGSRMTIDA